MRNMTLCVAVDLSISGDTVGMKKPINKDVKI